MVIFANEFTFLAYYIMTLNPTFAPLLSLCLLHSVSVTASTQYEPRTIDGFMKYSEGFYDSSTGQTMAAQCNRSIKISEMLAVSKLSKYLTGSTISSTEINDDGKFKIATHSTSNSIRPDYKVLTTGSFDNYFCTLVATTLH